jgi:hypothetical protein
MTNSSASHVQSVAPSTPTWADTALKDWLNDKFADGASVVTMVHSNFQCAFFADDGTDTVDRGDPDMLSIPVLRKLASKHRLHKLEIPAHEFQTAKQRGADWVARSTSATANDLKAWQQARMAALGAGRGRPLKAADELQIWHDAGGRCMYRGCAKDVGRTSLTTKAAAAAYLAHIVASDPNGPRGGATSIALSDNPANIMLMCDEHHRLIDRIEVDEHTPELLNEMRKTHVDSVRLALDGLAFKRSKAVALIGDIANLATSAAERDMRAAVLQRQLACDPRVDYILRRTQRDDRTQPNFWQYLLHEHEQGILELRRLLGSNQSLGDSCEVLSVFALLPVPLLVLVGRIIGEARPVELYQYDRTRSTWCFDATVLPQSPDTFSLVEPQAPVTAPEVLLTFELTAELDLNALPPGLATRVSSGSLPWVRVRHLNPNESCIGTKDDLIQFSKVAREAIRLVQDKMRASHVHLIGIGPASTLVAFGQMLQAGHHSTYTVYDRPNMQANFGPALTISGDRVISAGGTSGSVEKTIMLR